MSKEMKILAAVLVIAVSSVSFAKPPADPLEESLQVISGVAEGSVTAVADVVEGTAQAIVGLTEGAATSFEKDVLSMPGRFLGKDVMSATGITVGVSSVNVYQQNVRGGASTNDKNGRFNGSYGLEVAADFERLFGFEGIGFYTAAEGAWSKSGDIDGDSVGSAFGVNGAGGSRRSMDVVEAWFEGAIFEGAVRVRAGKMDIAGGFQSNGQTVAFDSGTYAGSSSSQFLNGGLGGNPTVPFPSKGIGAAVFYNPCDMWYASFGVADVQADSRETGINTAFSDEDYFFYVFETGLTPELESSNGVLPGAYRVGLWVDGQDKARFSNGENYRDDTGVYVSCDQMLMRENDDPEDSQGAGAFFRWGYANSDLNDIGNFWSIGVQYQGLIESRDDDVLGIGMAQGIFSDLPGAGFTDDTETAYEVYYNAVVNDYMTLSPSLQYVVDPGGADGGTDAVVLGLRAVVAF